MIGLGLGLSLGTSGSSGGAPAAWAPTDASVSLLAWYRPDLGLTQAGGLVSAWLDQSGAGDANRDQAAAGAARPGYVATDAAYGNQPVITGNGSQRMLSAGAWSAAPAFPLTVLVVGETAASSSFLGDSTTNNMLYANAGANETIYGAVAGANAGTGNPSVPCVVMYTDDGTTANIYVTDLDTPTGTFVPAPPGPVWSGATRIDLLSGFGAGFPGLTGKIAEVIVWGGVIDATDKTNLVTYLNTTRAYGLGVT